MLLTEAFIDDMDASLRQIGMGDFTVGKHVGRLMGAHLVPKLLAGGHTVRLIGRTKPSNDELAKAVAS